jgi:hypothetical protein
MVIFVNKPFMDNTEKLVSGFSILTCILEVPDSNLY